MCNIVWDKARAEASVWGMFQLYVQILSSAGWCTWVKCRKIWPSEKWVSFHIWSVILWTSVCFRDKKINLIVNLPWAGALSNTFTCFLTVTEHLRFRLKSVVLRQNLDVLQGRRLFHQHLLGLMKTNLPPRPKKVLEIDAHPSQTWLETMRCFS